MATRSSWSAASLWWGGAGHGGEPGGGPARGGEGTGVHLRLGEQLFSLRRAKVGAVGTATVSHEVGGIRLATETLGLDAWSTRVSTALLARAKADSAAADALTGLLNPRAPD